MANYNLTVYQIEISGCHEMMFVPFFSIDSDFSENEEYWREDTKELGFKSEAERCSKELFEELGGHDFFLDDYAGSLSQALYKAADYSFDGNQFIAGNSTYTAQYDITLICIDNDHNDYVAVISMMG